MVEKKLKATFLVPYRDNDGSSLSQAHDILRADLLNEFGGHTQGGSVDGTWKNECGQTFCDESASYWLLLDAEDLPRLEALLLDFKSRTKQEAIYLDVVEVEVRFV